MMAYAKKKDVESFRKSQIYYCESGYTRNWEYPWTYLNSNLKGSLKILDIGPGKSDFPMFLKSKGHNVSIIDIPNKKGWGIKEFLKKNTNIDYRIEDVRNMGWEADTFDRVYCISVLEHMKTQKDVIKALYEIKRVLKKYGLAIITYDSYLKEFPNLKGLNIEKETRRLGLRLYKESTVKKRDIKNKDLLFASKGKILNKDIKLDSLFCFKKYLKKYSNIYVPIGIVLQK